MASDSEQDGVYTLRHFDDEHGRENDQHIADSPLRSESESGSRSRGLQSSRDSEDESEQAILADDGAADSASTTSTFSSESDDSHPPNLRSHNTFFDLEASESESGSAAESFAEWDDSGALLSASFTDFMKLPAELREMIWIEFCPDLLPRPRVFEFMTSGEDYIVPSPQIEFQTEPTRRLLAVHRESRRLALRSSPDNINLPHGAAFVPYNKERDVIYLDVPPAHLDDLAQVIKKCLPRMAPDIQNFAFPAALYTSDWEDVIDSLPFVRNLYVLADADSLPTKGLTWCVSGNNHEYQVDFEESEPGLGEDVSMLFCWPDAQKYGKDGDRIFNRWLGEINVYPISASGDSDSEEEHPMNHAVEEWGHFMYLLRAQYLMRWVSAARDDNVEPSKEMSKHPPTRIWPMTRFTHDGMQHLQRMKEWQRPWNDWVSEDGEGSRVEDDEYESDFIDDFQYDNDDILPTDIEDDFGEDIPHDALPLPSDSENESAADVLDQFIHERLSTVRRKNTDMEPHADSDESSDDDDSGDQNDNSSITSRNHKSSHGARPRRKILDSESDDESDQDAKTSNDPKHHKKRRTRPVVLDSDSDSDGDEEDRKEPSAAAGHSRVDKRRRRAIFSDSDDQNSGNSDGEVESVPRRSVKRQKVFAASSDSEDDSDQDDAAQSPQKEANRRTRDNVSSSSESEQDSSVSSEDGESSSDDERPAHSNLKSKKPSLATRLQMEYRQARADYDAEHDSSDDNSMASSEVREQFEDVEGSSSDGSDGGRGLSLNMAEESEEEDEDDIDGEVW
ncbi:hypothetical protein BD289DRAFT_425142 [Coniella lustricola]|uniref:2EXR domain-containing protein n=1 Tax=Coniella lustricola TaxID=2025994 RepID=A0A2T3AHS0_9PEZI|nr:hypothetical protein BD289DRAFT_425142 [Coniella lustricola]